MNDLQDQTYDAQKRVHVMLIEDSILIRQALTESLSTSPVACFDGFAGSAQDAIQTLRSRRFDILVIDIELAHGTGFDVLQDINKPDYPYPAPISIVLTNRSGPTCLNSRPSILSGISADSHAACFSVGSITA